MTLTARSTDVVDVVDVGPATAQDLATEHEIGALR